MKPDDILHGDYCEIAEKEIINLAATQSLWEQDTRSSQTNKLWFESCGTEYSLRREKGEIKRIFSVLAEKEGFIKIGDRLVNSRYIQAASYKGNKLKYYISGNSYNVRLSKEDATEVLKKLKGQKRFLEINGEVVNLNKATDIRFYKGGFLTNDRLRINLMGDGCFTFDISSEHLPAIEETILKRSHFKKIGDTCVNTATAANISFSGQTLKINYPGTSCTIKLDKQWHEFSSCFEEENGFIAIDQNKINTKILSSFLASEGGIFSSPHIKFKILDDTYSLSQTSETCQRIAAAIKADPDYVTIGDRLININSLAHAYYKGQRLYYIQGNETWSAKMSEDDGRALLDKISQHNKFIDLDGEIINLQFATNFEYKQKRLQFILGRDTRQFKVSEDKAEKLLEKVKQAATERQKYINENRPNQSPHMEDDLTWDLDLLAEIYEEIDRMHSTAATNAAVAAAFVACT